jgi:hypothetical protein
LYGIEQRLLSDLTSEWCWGLKFTSCRSENNEWNGLVLGTFLTLIENTNQRSETSVPHKKLTFFIWICTRESIGHRYFYGSCIAVDIKSSVMVIIDWLGMLRQRKGGVGGCENAAVAEAALDTNQYL